MPTVDVLRYYLELDSKRFVKGAKTADKQATKLSKTIGSKLTGAITGMVGAYTAFRALNIAGDLIMIGAKAEQTTTAFENMFGAGAQVLEEMKETSKGAIDEISLMTIAMKAKVMGIATETLPQLMEIARASAIAFGQSTEFMFDSIVTGIARKQPLILDNLGIIVNLTEIYANEIKKLGRQLTEAEKSQLLLNATIEAGQKTIRQVGVDAKTTAEDIATLSASYTNLKVEIGKALTEITGAGGWLPTMMDQVAWRIKMNNLIQESLELWRKEKAEILWRGLPAHQPFAPTPIPDIILKDLRKELDEFEVAVMRLYQSVGQISTQQLLLYFDTMLREYKLTAEQIKAIEKDIFNLKIQLIKDALTFEMKLRKDAPAPITPVEGFIGPTQDLTLDFKINILDKIQVALIDFGPLLVGAWKGILSQLEGAVGDFGRILTSFLEGDFVGGITSFFSQAASILFDEGEKQRQSVERQQEAIRRLREETERAIDSFHRMTIAMRERTILEIEQRMRFIERTLEQQGLAGRFEMEQELILLQEQLDALFGAIGESSVIRGIQSFQDLMDFIAGQGDLSYQAAQQLASTFIRLLDLTAEDQIALWEAILAQLEASGNATTWELLQIENLLQDLNDQVEASTRIERDLHPESQIMRSITTITETQANLMVSVLESIHLTLRQIFDALNNLIVNLNNITPAGAGIGNINITVQGNTVEQITDSLTREFRSRGIPLG